MRYKIIIIGVLLLSATNGFSQNNKDFRLEFSSKDAYINHTLFEFDTLGLIILSETKTGNIYKVEKYDTNFVKIKEILLDIPKRQHLRLYYTDEDSLLYFGFTSARNGFTVVKINVSDMTFIKNSGYLAPKTNISEMTAIDELVFFNFSIKNNYAIATFDIKTGEQKVIPFYLDGYKEKNIDFDKMKVVKNNENFVYVSAYQTGYKNTYILFFDKNGELLSTLDLNKNLDTYLNEVNAVSVGNDVYIFYGTYSKKNFSWSEGMYFAKANKKYVNYIKYYNFTDFANFLSYLPDRRVEKIEKKKEKKKAKGKNFSMSYMITSHDIMKVDSLYLYIGEAFYPTYRTETTNNGNDTQTEQVFDGYQYTHATVVVFDEMGNLVWDKTVNMWQNYKPYFPKKFITVSVNGNLISLLFMNRNKIVSTEYSLSGDVIKEENYSFLSTSNPNEEIRYSFADIIYWYDNYYLTNGFQKIKNTNDGSKRRVFFVSRLKY